MTGSRRHGWAVWAAMAFLFLAGVTTAYWAEAKGNPMLAAAGADQHASLLAPGGNMEGKECRFGIADSALFATVTTDASCGAINSWHDSFTPLGGLVPLDNILLGEVIFGGVGAGHVRHPRLRRPRRLHRRADGRTHARIPGQEDRGVRREDGDARRPRLPADDPGADRHLGRVADLRHCRASSTRARTASPRFSTPSRRHAATTARRSPA